MNEIKNNKHLKVEFNQNPYKWFRMEEFIDLQSGSKLSDSYPQSGFQMFKRESGGNKQYQFSVRHVLNKNKWEAREDLSSEWIEFLDFLNSMELVEMLESVTGLSLKDDEKDIGFFKFEQGDWVSPHTDRENKKLTFVLYFNREWHSSWGGCIQILKSNLSSSVVAESLPLVGNTVGIIRSDDSWHMVTQVSNEAKSFRKTVQVEFWNKENKS
ncbi:MAG: 2OG-Fe(II) oxygenase family protein [Bacteroidota bacterium]